VRACTWRHLCVHVRGMAPRRLRPVKGTFGFAGGRRASGGSGVFKNYDCVGVFYSCVLVKGAAV
jgi:hypothetical protein